MAREEECASSFWEISAAVLVCSITPFPLLVRDYTLSPCYLYSLSSVVLSYNKYMPFSWDFPGIFWGLHRCLWRYVLFRKYLFFIYLHYIYTYILVSDCVLFFFFFSLISLLYQLLWQSIWRRLPKWQCELEKLSDNQP